MCKSGQVSQAYELARTDLNGTPDGLWQQRALGWVLYYMIKGDSERGDYAKLLEHIDELKTLSQLTMDNDSLIFDNVLFQIANFIKNKVFLTDVDAFAKLSALFLRVREYVFKPSRAHSYYLQVVIKFENWQELADFFDWWNLDNLMPDDYKPYVNQNGQKMMTLAERAFIANSKALLKKNDLGRIEEFLPKLDKLMNQHEEMVYPGYFYGKLLLVLGSNADEALKVIVPFARKKSAEFWVWQLLGDVFVDNEEKRLACLLRAVHCRTQESFLGKVRIKLAQIYINGNQPGKARYHIDMFVRCYVSHGWRLPYEIDCWMHQPWFDAAVPDGKETIDYKSITDDILCDGAEECMAVVTYVDSNSCKSYMVYGREKKMSQKLRFKNLPGDALRLHYIKSKEGRIKILSATKVQIPENLDYARHVTGTIAKRSEKDFAFLRVGKVQCFVSPAVVQKYNLNHGDNVFGVIVYDYDKKKDSWNWVCVKVEKIR